MFQVRTYNILPVLTQLLQAYEKHDSVNGRVFRIVGNICQHIERLSNHVIEKEPKLIDGIVKFLKATITDENTEAKVSKATINMGIRALRYCFVLYYLQNCIKNVVLQGTFKQLFYCTTS